MTTPSEGVSSNPGAQNSAQPAGARPMRASDQERDEIVQQLQTAFAEGRLDEDEFDTRVRTALGARTQVELEQLIADLPTSTVGPAVSVRSTLGNLLGSLVIAVMGHTARRGRWRVPKQCTAISIMGRCSLDLRAAQLEARVTSINAVAIMGRVGVLVPPGVRVEMSGLPLMGDCVNRVREDDLPPDAPVIKVFGFAVMGSVGARTKTSKRRRRS